VGRDATGPDRIAAMLAEAGYTDVQVRSRMPSMLQAIHARRA
jgi:hypothetical protein